MNLRERCTPTTRCYVSLVVLVWLLLVLAGEEMLLLMCSSRGDLRASEVGAECRWEFVSYEPSRYELLWTQNARQWADNVCDVLREEEHRRASELIIRRVIQFTDSGYLSAQSTPLSEEEVMKADELMSTLRYSKLCRGAERDEEVVEEGAQMIEPLWGFLRDPFDVYCNLSMAGWQADKGQSKAHILPLVQAPFAVRKACTDPWRWAAGGLAPWWKVPAGRPSRKVLIDLGSAYFRSWGDNNHISSGEWFYNMYHTKGCLFDHFVAVEVTPLQDEKAYQQLPKDLLGIYNLVNVRLGVGSNRSGDPFELITNLADKDDLLVMKLDVDGSDLEQTIPARLMEDAGFAALFDEFMFEHHVSLPVMNPHWKVNTTETLADSYRLFSELRHKGIRSHSWP